MSAPSSAAAPADVSTAAPHEMPAMSPASWRARLVATWLTADPRSLGFLRICLGVLLLGDVLRRAPGVIEWYSNEGLLPNHTMLWRPMARWTFSVFFLASTPAEAGVLLALCGAVAVGLLVGWRTRLMQVLALVVSVSLHSRAIILENGGDVVMNLVFAWSMFLPLGRRFSLDALLASLRARKETTAADLQDRSAFAGDTRPVVSLAVLAMLLQASVIYFFNTVHKDGHVWRSGQAISYVLQQDRIITYLGSLIRDGFPIWASKAMSWGTLIVEGVAPLLIFTPFFTVWARRIAIASLFSLHLGIALLMNVGFFSPTMWMFYPVLLVASEWETLSKKLRHESRAREIYFDAGCGICFACVRILARMDRFHLLRFVANHEGERLPKGVTPELVESTIVSFDPRTGRFTTRAAAFSEIFAALPLGPLWAWTLRAPLVAQVANLVYDAVARNRRSISVGLGLAACGLPRPAGAASPAIDVELPAPAFERARIVLREGLVLLVLVALGSQLLIENRFFPQWMKPRQPTWMAAIVTYPRLFQGWSMFAPNPPTSDGMVVVEARTIDGRIVDPYNWVASHWRGPPPDRMPGRLDQDQFWCDYTNRIHQKNNAPYWDPLREWLLKHHLRTGNPNDRIVSFDAYWLEQGRTLPGQTPPEPKKTRFLSHPARADAPAESPTRP